MPASTFPPRAVVLDGLAGLRLTAARVGALLTVLALLCTLVVTVAAPPAAAGTYRADDEVTYKEYWVPHSEFTGGCGASAAPGGGTPSIEPWGCEKTLSFTIPDDVSQSLRVEVYIDLWRNHTKRVARFRVNDGPTRQPDVGADWSRTPYVGAIPASELRQGVNNITFWSQAGGYHVYDVGFRVYHDGANPLVAGAGSDVVPPEGTLTGITADNGEFPPGEPAILKVDSDALTLTADAQEAAFVEFHADYEGYDEDNDGVFADWHASGRNNWHPGGTSPKAGGGTINHAGTDTSAPYAVTWRLPHVVNQAAVRFKVRVVDGAGNVREAAGGVSAAFTLSRHDDVRSYRVPEFSDAVLHHGGSKPKVVTREVVLPADLTDVKSAHLVGAYWQNPFVSLNGNPEFLAFASGEDIWRLSIRQLQPSHLVPGPNEIRYRYNPNDGFGEFIEKPGPMVVLRRADTGPARLVSEPREASVREGESATFAVEATGAGPLTYQWQRDGVDIPGATAATYTTPPMTPTDDGATFRVTVANAQGSVTSRTAPLHVRTLGAIVSDDFDASALNDDLWTFSDPLGDSALSITGTEARIAVPAGVTHDLWSGADHAPRLLQHVDDADLGAEVKFDSVVEQRYQGQGIVVQGDHGFLRFGTFHDGSRARLFVSIAGSGSATTVHNKVLDGAAPRWLRVAREGDQWTLRTSHDGSLWTTAVTFAHVMAVREIGPYALNLGSPAPAHTAVVDHFYNTAAPGDGDPAPDTTAPQIDLMAVDADVWSATITWETDEPATSTVLFGETAAYEGGTVDGTAPVMTHAIDLSGLMCATTYHYAVSSTDAAGNTATASGATFTTASCPAPDTTPPSISDVTVTATSSSVTVTWVTEEESTSAVAYGLDSAYEHGTVDEPALITGHRITLDGLDCEQTYHLQARSADAAGNVATSDDHEVTLGDCPLGVRSDDFDGGALNTQLWTFVDPVGDAQLSMTGHSAAIDVPAGVRHDLWEAANEAPRLRQEALDVDFEVEVKLESDVTERFQMQGIVVEQDDDDFLRFELHHDGTTARAFAATVIGGSATTQSNVPVPTGSPVWLRVARAGDDWTYRYSHDGETWTVAAQFLLPMTVTAVGPYVGNQGGPPPAHRGAIDYFYNAAVPGDGDAGPDTTAPVISGVTVDTTASSATVAWATDEPADSMVVYGASAAYESGSAGDPGLVTAHEAELTGLQCDSTYHFRLQSADVAGNVAATPDATFTTDACPPPDTTAPVISGVAVDVSATSATVTWTTDEPATSAIAYGLTAAFEDGVIEDADLATAHSVTLTGLAAQSTYHFEVIAVDAAGNETTHSSTFATLSAIIESDDFNAATLNPRWSVVDPVGDGQVEVLGSGTGQAHLRLFVPAGSSHDVSSPNRALRVVQDVPDQDFTAEVKFDSAPSARYQMQGLLVQQDADDWLRFEFHHDGSTLRAYAASMGSGSLQGRLNVAVASAPSLYLRVQRQGDGWTMSTSTDGSTWMPRGEFDHSLSVAQVGPFAANHHPTRSRTPAYTAIVDYVFDGLAPIVPEDPQAGDPPADTFGLTTGVQGQGTVAASPQRASYDQGEEVTLTATPAVGWQFAGWSGDLSGTANPAVLLMDVDKSVTATFAEVDDTTPPQITGVQVDAGATSATVTWTTNEPASSAVAHGSTSAHEDGLVEDGALTTQHSATLDGLAPETTYHFAVTSVDAAGNATTSPDDTFMTAASAGGPAITVWYGDDQPFGHLGQPQTWVNVLGNVVDGDGVAALTYSLNGGSPRPLSLGPDKKRLSAKGDFNVELPYSALAPGANTVVLHATDSLGHVSTKTVTVHYTSGTVTPVPYQTDWAGSTEVNESAQVVDGAWRLDGDGIRTDELGYDRAVAIGDITWQDYEASVPVTVYGFGPGAYSHLSGPPLVGIGLRWQGHTSSGSQPSTGFWPTGAFAWYRWYENGARHQLIGNNSSVDSHSPSPAMSFGVTYVLKARVEEVGGGTRYRYKAWEAGQPEPAEWRLDINVADGPASGSVLLLAHHVDARFGDVTVTPLENGG